MKLTGNEMVSLCTEIFDTPIWSISKLTLDKLLNSHILGEVEEKLKNNEEIQKVEVSYLSIDDMIIPKGTKINAKFRISISKTLKEKFFSEYFESNFTYLDIADFYNVVMDLFYSHSKTNNTNITNIKLEFIDIDIMFPLAFKDGGFINSNLLSQYDLDGQLCILNHLLRSQDWHIKDNKIIFPKIMDEKHLQILLDLFTSNFKIDMEKQKSDILDYCSIFGLDSGRKHVNNNLEKENILKKQLEEIKKSYEEYHVQNAEKYEPKFAKED